MTKSVKIRKNRRQLKRWIWPRQQYLIRGYWIEFMTGSEGEADEKVPTHNNTNWLETLNKLKWGQAFGSPPNAQTDRPEKPPSGIQDLSYRRDLKEKQEDKRRDGKTAWMSLWKMKKLTLHTTAYHLHDLQHQQHHQPQRNVWRHRPCVLQVNLSIPDFASACVFWSNLALNLSRPSFFQFAYPARISTHCRCTVSLEVPLILQRSSFHQISDVFSRGHHPITHAHRTRCLALVGHIFNEGCHCHCHVHSFWHARASHAPQLFVSSPPLKLLSSFHELSPRSFLSCHSSLHVYKLNIKPKTLLIKVVRHY